MRTYIFIISLVVFSHTFGQEKAKDTVKKNNYGLRIGTDISKLIKTAVIEDYNAFEINADFEFIEKFYLAGEYGRENRTLDETQLNYTAEGNYYKIGVDYNTYENWLNMKNAIFVGLRYGSSTYKNTLNSYSILNPDSYWSENQVKTTPVTYEDSKTQFIEFLLGIKAEIFNNVYLGINVQLKKYIDNQNPDNFENLYIPGFGTTTADSKWGVGFGYTVSYYIPLIKIK